MEFVGKDTLLLADPPHPHWEDANFANYRMHDVKTSKRGSELHTVSMFERSAELQSMYFAAIHGDAHLEERNSTSQRLANVHGDRPTAFSVDFKVYTWDRMIADYNESFCGGIRRLQRIPHQRGVNVIKRRGSPCPPTVTTRLSGIPRRRLSWIARTGSGKAW